MEKHHLRELHLFPQSEISHHRHVDTHAPPLDLQLSINPPRPPTVPPSKAVEELRWQAAEQMRVAEKEKAYAERVKDVTRREIEMAKADLARARILWDKTTEELAKAETIKLSSVIRVTNYPPSSSTTTGTDNYTCMEITCHCCKRRFRP